MEGLRGHVLVAHCEDGVVVHPRGGVGRVFGRVFHVAHVARHPSSPAAHDHLLDICIDHPQAFRECGSIGGRASCLERVGFVVDPGMQHPAVAP